MARPTSSFTYTANHKRVRRHRGPAKLHDCQDCHSKQAHDWALTHDADPADPASYRPLCKSCHMRYDDVGGHTHPQPNKLDAGMVRDIRSRRAAGEGATALAREYDINPHTVHDVVSRRIWKHV